MIAFRKDFQPDNKKDIKNVLQDILDKIYGTEEYKKVNISDLIEILYRKLYTENKTALQIMVLKNKDNSLDIVIDNLDEEY